MRHPILEIHPTDAHGCMAKLKATLIDGMDTSGDAAKVGTALHRVAEALTFELAEHPAADKWDVGRKAVALAARELEMSPAAYADALMLLEKVLAPESRVDLHPTPGWSGSAEYRWFLVERDGDLIGVTALSEGEEAFASGTIDLLQWTPGFGVVRIDDFKTKRQMLGPEDVWESFQMRVYAFAILRIPCFAKCERIEGRLVMLRHGYTTTADFIPGDPWEQQVEEHLYAIHEARKKCVAEDKWPATSGPWCQYCPVRHKCDVVAAVVKSGGVPDGTPSEMARALGAVKSIVGDLDDMVRELVDGDELNAPIPLGDPLGTVLGYKPSQGWEVLLPYEETMQRLRELGMTKDLEIEHFRFVAANHYPSRVKKVLKDVLRVDPDTLEQLVIPISNMTFTTYRPEKKAAAATTFTDLDEVERALDRRSKG